MQENKIPNEPLTDVEIKERQDTIQRVRNEIQLREQYIAKLENEIQKGIYTSTPEQDKISWDYITKIVQHDKDIGLQCATGKCNNLINYICPDCAEKQNSWNKHGSK